MSSENIPQPPSVETPLERLLTQAADYTPTTPMPLGLEARALQRLTSRRVAWRGGYRAISYGLACGLALAGVLVWRAERTPPPPLVFTPTTTPSVQKPTLPLPPFPLNRGPQFAVTPSPSGQPKTEEPTKSRWKPRRTRLRYAAWQPPRRRSVDSKPKIAPAVWRTERITIVQQGVILPVWIAEPDENPEQLRLTPAVLNLPLPPGSPIPIALNQEAAPIIPASDLHDTTGEEPNAE